MPPKRSNDPLDNPKGPKIRGLAYTGQQPAFLRNAMSALSGRTASSSSSAVGPDGRPAIPTRPGGGGSEDGSDGEEEQDEWDLGRGDEAPQVVVLKEGKHLERDEVDRLREQAKSSGTSDPLHTADSSSSTSKTTGSLSFSSSTGPSSRTKPIGVGGTGDWADVLKSAGAGSEVKKRDGAGAGGEKGEKVPPAQPVLSKEEKAKLKEKEEKKKKKEKKKDAKKIAMLSFEDE